MIRDPAFKIHAPALISDAPALVVVKDTDPPTGSDDPRSLSMPKTVKLKPDVKIRAESHTNPRNKGIRTESKHQEPRKDLPSYPSEASVWR